MAEPQPRAAITNTPSISVVVPTYHRPDHLGRCLDGLQRQVRPPDQIVVVSRSDDMPTRRALAGQKDRRVIEVLVSRAGVLAAMEAGTLKATGSIVAFTDDDAVARPDWLQRISCLLDDPSVGGVGGRDVQPQSDGSALTGDVGRITAWGKVIGNHHSGIGPPRDVMVLKAVNMAFRREALRLPAGLRGEGAQAHFEVATCLWARRRGWRLLYDPQLVVDHYPGPRFDQDHRRTPGDAAVRDAAYNLVWCLLSEEPGLYWRRAAYGLAIGDRAAPGLARAAVAAFTGEWRIARRLIPSLEGQVGALRDTRRGATR